MKRPWLVTYSSVTGNTCKVAEAICRALPPGSTICPVEVAPDAAGFEKVAVGFWADKGRADAKAAAYIGKIKAGKVFLFATMGAYPYSKHAQTVMQRGVGLLDDSCRLLGCFICQGQTAQYLKERALARPTEHPRAVTPELLRRWADSDKHPNEADFAQAQALISKCL